MKYSTNQFKQGLKILIDGEPCSIISYEFHKPGKGQAVMRTKLYNLRTQKVWERTFKSGESVEEADILEKDFQFLYSEGQNFVFMDQANFEQIEVPFDKLVNVKDWLDGEEKVVNILRIGRLALMYQLKDQSQAGIWDSEQNDWVEVSGYRLPVRDGIRMANKTAPLDLLAVPVKFQGGE